MDRFRPRADDILQPKTPEASRVDLGAGAPRPTDRGFSVGIPGLAGFSVTPEMFAEGFFGRKSPRDGFTVSQSGGSGKFGATVVGPDGHRFTAGVPLNYLSGEVEFSDKLRARGAPENIEFGTDGIERGPIEGRYESPGGFSASGSYDPRTGEGGFYLNKVVKFEEGGVAGGIGSYLDQLDLSDAERAQIEASFSPFSSTLPELDADVPGQGTISPDYNPRFRDELSSSVGGLFGDDRESFRRGQRALDVLDFTPAGTPIAVGEVDDALGRDDYVGAGIGALGLIPVVGGTLRKAAKATPIRVYPQNAWEKLTGEKVPEGVWGNPNSAVAQSSERYNGNTYLGGEISSVGNPDTPARASAMVFGENLDDGLSQLRKNVDGRPRTAVDVNMVKEGKWRFVSEKTPGSLVVTPHSPGDAAREKLTAVKVNNADLRDRIKKDPKLSQEVGLINPNGNFIGHLYAKKVNFQDGVHLKGRKTGDQPRATAHHPKGYVEYGDVVGYMRTSVADDPSKYRPVFDYVNVYEDGGAVEGYVSEEDGGLTFDEKGDYSFSHLSDSPTDNPTFSLDLTPTNDYSEFGSQVEGAVSQNVGDFLGSLGTAAGLVSNPGLAAANLASTVVGGQSIPGMISSMFDVSVPKSLSNPLGIYGLKNSAGYNPSFSPTDEPLAGGVDPGNIGLGYEATDYYGDIGRSGHGFGGVDFGGYASGSTDTGYGVSDTQGGGEEAGVGPPGTGGDYSDSDDDHGQSTDFADGGVAGLSAAREFKDAGTFPDFMAARLGSMDRRDDAVARKLLGGNASSQVLGQVSRILNSSSDPIKTFADGGSVRSQRLPPDRPPRLGGISRVPRRDLIRLADDEFAHTVEPHFKGSPLASAELMMRQTRPGSGDSEGKIPLLSDDFDVRPVTLRRLTDTFTSDHAYRGRLRNLDSGEPLYDSSDFEGPFSIPVISQLQGMMYAKDRFNPEAVDPRVMGVLVNDMPGYYERLQAAAAGDTLEGLSSAARANNERVATVARHEMEHAFLTRARDSLSDYIETTGTDSALGTLLTTNVFGEKGSRDYEHRFLLNIYDAANYVDDGNIDPSNEEQLKLYSRLFKLSDSEMKAAVALSENGSVEDLPKKYKDSEYKPLVDLIRRSEKEAATQIRAALNSEGYTKAQIDSALGIQDFERKTNFVGMDSTGNDDDTKNVLRAEPHFVGMDSTGNDDDTKNPVSRLQRFRKIFRSILGGRN